MHKRKLATRAAVVLALVGLIGPVTAQPAVANGSSWSKSRSGCKYSGGLNPNHDHAWTQKDSGSCAGHAWVKVEFTNGETAERHEPELAEFKGRKIVHVWHKTQSSESWQKSH